MLFKKMRNVLNWIFEISLEFFFWCDFWFLSYGGFCILSSQCIQDLDELKKMYVLLHIKIAEKTVAIQEYKNKTIIHNGFINMVAGDIELEYLILFSFATLHIYIYDI